MGQAGEADKSRGEGLAAVDLDHHPTGFGLQALPYIQESLVEACLFFVPITGKSRSSEQQEMA